MRATRRSQTDVTRFPAGVRRDQHGTVGADRFCGRAAGNVRVEIDRNFIRRYRSHRRIASYQRKEHSPRWRKKRERECRPRFHQADCESCRAIMQLPGWRPTPENRRSRLPVTFAESESQVRARLGQAVGAQPQAAAAARAWLVGETCSIFPSHAISGYSRNARRLAGIPGPIGERGNLRQTHCRSAVKLRRLPAGNRSIVLPTVPQS